jgi:hypothetical protein
MRWLANEGLSALVAFALVIGMLYVVTDTWVRGVLMLTALAFVAVPFAQDEDYAIRVLILAVAALAYLVGVSVYYAWDDGWTAWHVKAFIVALTAASAWIWIQREAPWKLWVIPAVVLVAAGWLYVRIATPGAFAENDVAPEVIDIEHTPIRTLLRRDAIFLQAVYDATNGRPEIYVAAWELLDNVRLSPEQAEVAADRLCRNGSIRLDEHGIALKRKGVDAVERSHREKRKREPVTNTFNFHGNPSGVFGSHNTVRGNVFRSDAVPADLLQAALSAAVELRDQLTPARAREIELAVADLQETGADEGRLRRGARRMAEVAGAVGEIGAPLLRTATEILRLLPG